MSDQDDFDQALTPSQEYSIAFLVILLFGAMYWFFTQGSQPNASSIVQSTGVPQSSYLSSNSVPNSGNQVTAPEENKPSLDADSSEVNSDEDITQHADTNKNTDTSLADSDGLLKEGSVSEKNSLSSQATIAQNNKLKEEAAALAAATSAQQIADEARFNAKQLELKAGEAELVIPPKPADSESAKQSELAAASTLPKQVAQAPTNSPTTQPDTKEFVMFDELARVDFKLPDGRTIQIPKQGFESQFKQSILKDDEQQTLVFDRVTFFPGSDLLNPQSSNQILGVAGILNTYKDIKIKLRGHTDSTGPAEDNLALSFKRSLNLKKQLVGLGINTQRIQVEGLGSSEPISDNGSEQGRNKNRRIDLTIIR